MPFKDIEDKRAWAREYARAWRSIPENRERTNATARRSTHNRKLRVLAAYSGIPPKCAYCGEADPVVLCIDHINGGGLKHRRTLGRGHSNVGAGVFYQWLEKNGFPGGFQVLCANCNMRKEYG